MNVLILVLSALISLAGSEPSLDSGSCLPKYGTTVEWERSPDQAAERARKEGKLLMVLHLAGELPDPDLT